MNEASERVLLKFAELLRNNPNGNVPFLWVQAGGRVASQQSFAPDGGDSAPSQVLSTPDMFSAIEHEPTPAPRR